MKIKVSLTIEEQGKKIKINRVLDIETDLPPMTIAKFTLQLLAEQFHSKKNTFPNKD